MTVFKGFLIIAKRNIAMFLIYIFIFFTICLLYNLTAPEQSQAVFESSSVEIGIVDLDRSELSVGFTDYLAGVHNVTMLENDKALLQESLLYRDVEYLITIPSGFESQLSLGIQLEVTTVCDIPQSSYVGQMINWYLSGAEALIGAGYTVSDAIQILKDSASVQADVTVVSSQYVQAVLPPYAPQYVVLPYITIAITCFTLGSITMEFYKPDILRRLNASIVSPFRRNIEFLSGYLVFGLAIWIFFNIVPLLLYGGQFIRDPNFIWHLANSFALVLSGLGITAILGLFVRRQEVLTALVNIISIGMSFLCGVFVSLDVLSEKITNISRFLPVYWYESVTMILLSHKELTPANLSAVVTGIGIQLLFTAVFIALALVLGRVRSREV